MPRISSTSSGTDITVEPRLISRPVTEMNDEELLAEVIALRGARGVTVKEAREKTERVAAVKKESKNATKNQETFE